MQRRCHTLRGWHSLVTCTVIDVAYVSPAILNASTQPIVGMGDELLSIETTKSRDDVANLLRSIADQLDGDAGHVRITAGDQSASVDIPDHLSVEIEIERSDEASELEIELEWSEQRH